jgi:hypothetical protein
LVMPVTNFKRSKRITDTIIPKRLAMRGLPALQRFRLTVDRLTCLKRGAQGDSCLEGRIPSPNSRIVARRMTRQISR